MKNALFATIAFLGVSCATGPLLGPGSSVPSDDSSQRVEALFESMRDGTYKGFGHCEPFPELQLADIPALLEHVDSPRLLATFPMNSLSSSWTNECSEGVAALWLIEGIRKGGRYASLNPRLNGNREESESHRPAAAKAYRAWWETAKQVPVGQAAKLRELDPLKGTGLAWH